MKRKCIDCGCTDIVMKDMSWEACSNCGTVFTLAGMIEERKGLEQKIKEIEALYNDNIGNALMHQIMCIIKPKTK